MEEPNNFEDITVTFDKIEKDPNHNEKFLYSFSLTPTPTPGWRAVFSERVWPLRQEFTPDMDAFFSSANRLIIRCYESYDETGINNGARDAVASASRHYWELVQEANAKRARDESESQRRESERERLIKEKTERLSGNS